MERHKRVNVYVDGAARGNPGPAGCGVVIKSDAKKTLKELSRYIGTATNNVAEYNALLCALEESLAMGAEEVVVYLDSELIAQQLKGEFRVRDEQMKILFDRAVDLINRFKRCEVVHIGREKNREADKLANKAINLAGLKRQVE